MNVSAIQTFGPDSALADARFLRGLGLGFCISPANELGEIGIDSPDWCAVTGRAGGLIVLEVNESDEIQLPPVPLTWRVLRPRVLHFWFSPPPLAESDPVPNSDAFGARVLALAPIPGSIHPATGDRYFWGVANPWTMPAPAPLPAEIWDALPKAGGSGFRPELMFSKRKKK